MKNTLSLLLISLILTLTQCKSDITIVPKNPEVDAATSYQPVTKDSYWKYHTTATVNHTVINATITMTGETEMLSGFLCHKYIYATAEGSKPGYYYHGNDIYLSISSSTPSAYDLRPYLKDNVDIGETWITAVGGTNRSVGKIVEKGITHTVNGKLFTDVIHTQFQLQYPDVGGTFVTFQTTDIYIAKGVGIIESDNQTPDGPESTTLQEYVIK